MLSVLAVEIAELTLKRIHQEVCDQRAPEVLQRIVPVLAFIFAEKVTLICL